MKPDVYQIVTDRLIRLLEAGTVPWRQPWKGGPQWPQNYVSRKLYRGINVFLLSAARYPSPFWLTFRQAQALGGKVRTGEHAMPVVFWKVFKEEDKRIPFLRYYNVFNVTQCEGITVPAVPDTTPAFEPISQCEQVVTDMPKRPVIQHQGHRACYSPVLDAVTMPEAKLFKSPEDYYSTLFHELTHASGHVTRLNRKEVTEPNRFGSDPYGREELVAEMGAAFLCAHCGIENQTIDQSAAYLASWLARLKEDRKLAVHAASQAQKACDFILDVHPGEEEATAEPPGTNPVPLPSSEQVAGIQTGVIQGKGAL
ncbi:MAG: DUF1738 domain-containing protein [Proteobacteria bacterium]|nr:DUF1738 domain-containing protein [Pseudomonadota bacterium]